MLLYYQGLSSWYLPWKGGLPVFKEDILWRDVRLAQAPPSWLPALQGANVRDSRLEHYSQGCQHHNQEAQNKKDHWGSQEGWHEETQKAVCINTAVSLLYFTKCSPSHTKPIFSNFCIHYMGFCFSPCWSGACRQGGKMLSALVAEYDRTKDHACKPQFHSYGFTVLSLMDKALVCTQHLHRGMALRKDLNCPCV